MGTDLKLKSCVTAALLCAAFPAAAEDESEMLAYVEGMRDAGFAQIAVEYIQSKIGQAGLTDETRASLEFELASTMIVASENEDNLGDRERRLEDARNSFADFARKHPEHPRRPESLFQLATIDLQMGRLRVIEAQLPANENRATELAQKARELFAKASADYAEADRQIAAEIAKMPAYLDPRGERDKYRLRDRLFEKQIESKFQSGLALYLIADSIETVDLRGQDPSQSSEYRENLQKALTIFEAIYNEHRRELVGLYGHLWMARCLAGLGEHDRAMGIYDILVEHENRDLEAFQREVFHFRVLSMYGQKKLRELTLLADDWLGKNARFREEWAYQGVQYAAAKAYIELGKETKDQAAAQRAFRDADRLLERLARFPNPYTGMARREQIALSDLAKGIKLEGDSFQELVTLANAKLDELKPEAEADAQLTILDAAIDFFRRAIRAVGPKDDPEEVGSAKLSLAYAYLQKDDMFATAVIGESLARQNPKLSVAPEGGMFALSAYASLYDSERQLAESSPTANPEVYARYMTSIGEHIIARWPRSGQGDEARLILGRLWYSKRQYDKAAEVLDSINPQSVQYSTALSLAGGCYWECFKAARAAKTTSSAAPDELAVKAKDRLTKASANFKKGDPELFDRERFLNDAILGEVLFESGDDKEALAVVRPLVERVKSNDLPDEIEPMLRIGALVTAMQVFVRTNQLEEIEELSTALSEQEGASGSANITSVYLSLAARLRAQFERLQSSGNTAAAQKMTASFEAFLDKVASRDAGQTRQSLVYLGEAYLAIGLYDKATDLFQRAISLEGSDDPAAKPAILRARMLIAQAQSLKGDHPAAIKEITALLRESPNSKELILERGRILEAANDYETAVQHWQWFLERLQRVQPRPVELYETTIRLADVCITASKRLTGAKRLQLLKEARHYPVYLLQTDVALPEEWREKFEAKVKEIQDLTGE